MSKRNELQLFNRIRLATYGCVDKVIDVTLITLSTTNI